MKYLLLFLIACTISTSCTASNRTTPSCIGNFCLDEALPQEKSVLAAFGGGVKKLSPNGTASYCYRFLERGKTYLYSLFILKEFGDELRVVTLRISTQKLCADPMPVSRHATLLTREGIGVGDSLSKVLEVYGSPGYSLERPSREVIQDFFGRERAPNTVSVSQYDAGDAQDLLSTRFFYDHESVIGIDISADE